MLRQSEIWLLIQSTGGKIYFSGVTQVRHSFSLKVATDTDSTEATDYLNGARKQPSRVTLSLVENDAGQPRGTSVRLAASLENIRAGRMLVTVYTPLRTYPNMLLSDLAFVQEESGPYGWTATAVFTEAVSVTTVVKANDNSSAITSTGTAAQRTVSNTSSGGGSAGTAGKAGTHAAVPGSVSGSGKTETRNYGNPLQQVLERSGIRTKPTSLMN